MEQIDASTKSVDTSELTVNVSRDELRALSNAIGETFEALEDGELQTRTGFDRNFFTALRRDIKAILHPTS